MHRAADRSLAGQLERDGWALATGVRSADACDRLAADLPPPDHTTGRRGGVRLRLGEGADTSERVSTIRAMQELARTATDDADLIPVRATLFDKSPEANWLVPWHQDLAVALAERNDAADGFGPWSVKDSIPHARAPITLLERMVAVRLHLDPCPADNGALLVLPGSHRWPPAPTSDKPPVDAAVTCEADTGDCVLMRPLAWHASRPAERPARRRVLHVEFGPPQPGPGVRWAWGAGPDAAGTTA
ncbi:MAG: phytanoyl-CoA dioxygenase family protein [Phycisphaerales bacterium]